MNPDLKAILRDGPPSALNAFKPSEPMEDDSFGIPAVNYDLSCYECGNDCFTVLTFIEVAPAPSPYADIEQGQTYYLPPHFARCVKCGHQAKIFDARTGGYDAAVNKFSSYKSGEGEPVELPGARTIRVGYLYNIEVSEMEEVALDMNVRVADQYDSMGIDALAEGHPDFREGYELA